MYIYSKLQLVNDANVKINKTVFSFTLFDFDLLIMPGNYLDYLSCSNQWCQKKLVMQACESWTK